MKRYVSVFEMITRSSIYKVLAILITMTVVELGTFYIALQQPLASIQPNLEEIVDQRHFVYIFKIAYLLITALIAFYGTNIGSIQGYTLQRLRIKEKKVFLLQCIYNILCYIFLWTTQLGVLLLVSGYYMTHKTNAVLTNQTVFLAFHRNEFMHSILPMQDIMNWVLLICFIVGTGYFTADFTQSQRRGKVAWILIVFIAIVCVTFPRGLEEDIVFVNISLIMVATFAIMKALGYKEVKADEK